MRRVTKKRSFFILASLLVLAVFYAGCNKENLPNEPLRQHVNYLLRQLLSWTRPFCGMRRVISCDEPLGRAGASGGGWFSQESFSGRLADQ